MRSEFPIDLQPAATSWDAPPSPDSLHPALEFLVRGGIVVTAWIAIGALRVIAPIGNSLVVHGIQDETGHLLTALMIAIAIGALRLPIPAWSILLGGVILDLGHITDLLDFTSPIAGSTRNGSHTILMVAVIALIGFVDHRRANMWLGIALGAITHLWRDMGSGFVPLAWPFTHQVWGTSFTRHWLVLIGVTAVILGSAALLEIHARAAPVRRSGEVG